MELRSLASSAIGMEADHWLGPKYWLFRKLWGVYTNIISHCWSKSGWVHQLKMLKALSKIQQVFPSTAVDASSCGWETPYHQHGCNIKLYTWSFFPTRFKRDSNILAVQRQSMTQRRDFMNFHDHLMTRQECTSGTKNWKNAQKKNAFSTGKTAFSTGKSAFSKNCKIINFPPNFGKCRSNPQSLESADQIPKVWKLKGPQHFFRVEKIIGCYPFLQGHSCPNSHSKVAHWI